MGDTEQLVTEVYVRIAELGLAMEGGPINRKPGAWRHKFADKNGMEWEIAVNGHKTPVPDPLFPGGDIEPFRAVVAFNGWPFATLDPFGGEMGAGEAANEDTFIAAVVAETERIKTELSVFRQEKETR